MASEPEATEALPDKGPSSVHEWRSHGSQEQDVHHWRPHGTQDDKAHAWLEQALRAERHAVAAELERRHKLLMNEVDRKFGERAVPANAGQTDITMSPGLTPKLPSTSPSMFVNNPERVSSGVVDATSPGTKHHSKNIPGAHRRHENPKPSAEEAGHTQNGRAPWTVQRVVETIVLSHHFEMFFGALILLNTLVMCLRMQYEGVHVDHMIKYSSVRPGSAEDVWPGVADGFVTLGWFFGIAFTVELVLKMCVLRMQFWRSGWNLLDFVVVMFWLIDKATAETNLFAIDPMMLRFCRLARLLRLAKAMRFLQMFDALQVLIASIKGSMAVLLWSTLLLFAIMMVCAMIMSHFLQEFMLDETKPVDVRHDVYKYFGSFSRGMVTMLELTLGNWVPVCRLLMENLMEWYGFFIVIYKIMVGFGVVKVITGCFLHETFKVASTDDEIMIMRKQREQESHRGKMERLFASADDQGNGTLTREEFAEVLSEEHVKTWLSAMEISFDDANMLFELIASTALDEEQQDEPRISASEFLQGTTRLRGSAKSLDMWQVLTQVEKIVVSIKHLSEALEIESSRNGHSDHRHHVHHEKPTDDAALHTPPTSRIRPLEDECPASTEAEQPDQGDLKSI